MKTAVRIWLIAALVECLIYAILLKGLEVVPIVGIIALVGGFPGMLLLAFGMELTHLGWDGGHRKWIMFLLFTVFAANATLALFLLLLGTGFTDTGLPCFTVVNIAALTGFFCSLPAIRKQYFEPAQEPQDVTHQSPYQFKQDYDQN